MRGDFSQRPSACPPPPPLQSPPTLPHPSEPPHCPTTPFCRPSDRHPLNPILCTTHKLLYQALVAAS
ncbi:hypothetical protein ANTQUA_LOCUS8037 [Anthophora quadrimaculata]